VIINKKLLPGLIVFIFIIAFYSLSYAATVTWTGDGSDSLASTSTNWNTILQNGDDVIIDNSPKDCAWDVNLTLSSLIINSGYNGIITLDTDLTVAGNVSISGGTLILNSGNLIIGSPSIVIFYPATNVNGNSATLSATVNPNGSDTTVYFECGIGESYDISTSLQSIGSGTNNVTVTANITNLIPNTNYQCRVVVTNSSGTVYGDNVTFTTPPITITILYPANGGTINRPNTFVRGTVTNTTGLETGVTVNGMMATAFNNEFILNHVTFTEGLNTISITATDTAGKTASTSIMVNALTSSPNVTLRANIESGIAPLTTYFSVSTEIPNSIASYTFDYEGDGTVDYTGTTFDDISVTYQAEGIYYPTITIIDDQGISYSDTIAIVVLNATELDTLLRAKWNAMKTALANQDVEGALGYFIDRSKDRYRTIFNAIGNQLPVITGTFIEFNVVNVYENVAEYQVVADESGVLYAYPGIFIKDGDGIWKFKDF